MVDTGGSSWHSTNRGVSVYIGIYLALFILVLVLSVSEKSSYVWKVVWRRGR